MQIAKWVHVVNYRNFTHLLQNHKYIKLALAMLDVRWDDKSTYVISTTNWANGSAVFRYFFHVVLLKVSAVAGHGSVLHNEALPAASGNKDKPNDTQGPAVILHSLSPNLNFISMQWNW